MGGLLGLIGYNPCRYHVNMSPHWLKESRKGGELLHDGHSSISAKSYFTDVAVMAGS